MKLSDALQDKLTVEAVDHSFEGYLSNKLDSYKNMLEGSAFADKLMSHCDELNTSLLSINRTLIEYKNSLQEKINSFEPEYTERSNKIYKDTETDSADYILRRTYSRNILKNKEVEDVFISRVGFYNSWKYPGLQIHPAQGVITDYIKGCDPLYLVDIKEELFSNVKNLWKDAYQRRLRYYTINETASSPYQFLPKDQIGFVVCANFFEFKTEDIILTHLESLYNSLRPGGVVMFTYNNCDLPYGAKNVENGFCCYQREQTLIKKTKKIGYELIRSYNEMENVSWLEIKKPGEIHSLRGGQTLGEIRSFN